MYIKNNLQTALRGCFLSVGGFFGFFALFIGFSDWFFAFGDALAVGFDLFFVAEAELYRCASKVKGFADGSFEVALVAPVDELEI